MSEKEMQRLTEWLKLKGKTKEEVAECIYYITTGTFPANTEE